MHSTVGMISKKRMILGAACLFFIFLTACGSKNIDKTTLEFYKNGSVELHIREMFDESLYSFDELSSMNEREVSAYNSSKGSTAVEIKKSAIEEGKAVIDILYGSDNDYYNMNGNVLFFGSCADARGAGYNLVGKVKSVSSASPLGQKEWKSMAEEKVAIISEAIDVYMPTEILFISDGITLTGTDSARVETGENGGLRYIICK